MDVLIVDDEKHILQIAKKFLERKKESLNVETASSGNEALELFKNNQYDAIVSDYKMPEMDGLELLKEIRENCTDTLFYILTGKADEKTPKKALAEGATGYFEKSAGSEEGFEKLSEILVESMEKKENISKHLVGWIVIREGWGETEAEKFENALYDLGEIIGCEISEIRTEKVSQEKNNIKAYTDHHIELPEAKIKKAKKWKEIVTDEPEVVDAGIKSRKIQEYD